MVSDSKVINSILAAVTLVLILLSFHQAAAKTDYSTDPIITILPYDAIPAVINPRFVTADEAELAQDSPVIGVSLNGESRPYSIHLLNGHEIVNDQVGGIPIATTW